MVDRPLSVLLVDDDRVDRLTLKRYLDSSSTFRVDCREAATAHAGIEALRDGRFDCAFVDYRLPDVDGVSLLEWVRALRVDTAILLVTGKGDETVAVTSLRAGAVDYLHKDGLTPEALEDALRRAIEARERGRSRAARLEELARENARLRRLASHDPLTGLPNRRRLERVVAREAERARRSGSSVVVALVDVDEFKDINDRFGHAVGDAGLRGVAARLRRDARASDRIGRIGGDEFLVLFPGSRFAEGLDGAERMRLHVGSEPFRHGGIRVRATASFGVAEIDPRRCTLENILRETREALHASKELGKDQVASSDEPSRDAAGSAILQSFEEEGFSVYRQAVCEVEGGEVVAYELLARAIDDSPTRPSSLHRAFRYPSVRARIDLLSLEACARCVRGLEPGSAVHLNLFPATLADVPAAEILARLGDLVTSYRLSIEISEQFVAGDPSVYRYTLEALRSAGIGIGLDDVDFGRAALESILVLRPDLVKIHPRFLSGGPHESGARRTLRRLVSAIRCAGALPIAEGIETLEDRERARASDLRVGQGFLWDRPTLFHPPA